MKHEKIMILTAHDISRLEKEGHMGEVEHDGKNTWLMCGNQCTAKMKEEAMA